MGATDINKVNIGGALTVLRHPGVLHRKSIVSEVQFMMLPPPSPTTHPGVTWARRYAVVTPGWSELYGHLPTWDDFFARIRQYPVDQALLHLAQVNGVIERLGAEGQAGLCHDLFYPDGDEVWARFLRFSKDLGSRGAQQRPWLFHPAQVLMTAKFVLASQPSESTPKGDSMRPLGEALLMLTDLLRRESAGTLEHILPVMMASHLFTFSDVRPNALGRSVELYMSDHPDLREHPSYVNLPSELERITGLSPVLLWSMLCAANGALQARHVNEHGAPFDLKHFLHAPQETLGGVTTYSFTDLEVERVMNLLVATIPQVSTDILDGGFSHMTALPYDVAEFARYPIIRHEGKDICMSEGLLFRKLTSGMHHIFLNPGATTKAQRDRYLRFTGAMFERYADSALRRCFSGQEGIYSGLLPNRDADCCDALWLCGDALVLFEFKAGQLGRDARSGSVERFGAKLKELVFEPARQMDSAIRLFKAGKLPIGGVDPERIRRFFPVAVVLEPLTMVPALHEQLLDEVRNRGHLQGEGVRPLQIMNVSELELLEVLMSRGLKLLHILAKKIDMPDWSGAGFHNFSRHQYLDHFKDGHNSHLCAVAEATKEQAIALLHERLGTPWVKSP